MQSSKRSAIEVIAFVLLTTIPISLTGCNGLFPKSLSGYIQSPRHTSYMVPRDWEASKPMPFISLGNWYDHAADEERTLKIEIFDENEVSVSAKTIIIPNRYTTEVAPIHRINYKGVTYMEMPDHGKYATMRFVLSDSESGKVIRESEKRINLVKYLVHD